MFTYNGVRAGLFGTLRNILTFRKVDRAIGEEWTTLDLDFV